MVRPLPVVWDGGMLTASVSVRHSAHTTTAAQCRVYQCSKQPTVTRTGLFIQHVTHDPSTKCNVIPTRSQQWVYFF